MSNCFRHLMRMREAPSIRLVWFCSVVADTIDKSLKIAKKTSMSPWVIGKEPAITLPRIDAHKTDGAWYVVDGCLSSTSSRIKYLFKYLLNMSGSLPSEHWIRCLKKTINTSFQKASLHLVYSMVHGITSCGKRAWSADYWNYFSVKYAQQSMLCLDRKIHCQMHLAYVLGTAELVFKPFLEKAITTVKMHLVDLFGFARL